MNTTLLLKGRTALNRVILLGWVAALCVVLSSLIPNVQAGRPQAVSTGPIVVNGYPEYHVEGKPFFPYAAGFFYHRFPADLWAPAMVKLKEIGFNTLDLYVIWNWHQPTEDVLDLDGRTNPRRNLKHLLELANSLGLKVILRPGPYIFNEWRNGGYPDWLLRKSGFHISPQAVTEGWFPVPSSVQYFNSEEAAQLWLENETHWNYTAKWFTELWKVIGPFSASRGGPVIAVQVDDDLAIGYSNDNGPTFWRYVHRNQRLFARAGVDVPLFTNAAFMRDTASASQPPGAAPLWIMGQWYLRTGTPRLEEGDVAGLQFAVEVLKTQPQFPPMMIEFNTNQYAGPKDTHATIIAPPRDMLLAARVLYQNGLRGNTIYPAQDTLYPAGWEFPPANYHYTWESALDIALNERPERAWVLKRDGDLIRGLGSLLAATHEQADVGLVYTLTAYPQEALRREDRAEFARRLVTLQQLAYHARINTQYIDLAHEPIDHLSRHRFVLLPVALFHRVGTSGGGQPLDMLEGAQQKLVDYVQSGGTLVVLPGLPKGSKLNALFPLSVAGVSRPGDKAPQVTLTGGLPLRVLGPRARFEARDVKGIEPVAFDADNQSVVGYQYRFGQGKVIVLGFDFFTWVRHAPVPTLGAWSPAEEFKPEEKRQALRVLDWLLDQADVRRSAVSLMLGADPLDEYLYTTLMVSNEGGSNGYGFVAATNWEDGGRRSDLRIADPRTGEPLVLPQVYVPGRDSVLLPVHIPLNRLVGRDGRGSSFSADEELLYSTAEVTAATFANRILALDLYAPGPAQIVLRMNNPPLGNVESEDEVLLTTYDRSSRLTRIEVPVGSAPDYRRTVRIPFPFQPVLNLQAEKVVLPGETLSMQVRLNNPGDQPLSGRLTLETPQPWPSVAAQSIQIAPGGQPLPGLGPAGQLFEFQVSVPDSAVPESEWDLRTCFESVRAWCSEPLRVRVTEPLRWRLRSQADFPVRDDVRLPTRPPLWAVTLPGQSMFHLKLENPLSQPVEAKLELEGEALWFELDTSSVQLAPGQETSVKLTVWPRPLSGADQTASGLYPFTIRVRMPRHTIEIPVRLVGIRKEEALAYWFDFDRDGFDDLVLENETLRAIIMPGAGGRAFALMNKATGRNALNTVGGLRDAFSKHPRNYTWKGVDLRRPPWRWPELMLHNRQAAVHITRGSGSEVEAELSYQADDVFPAGATVRKRLRLAGGSDVLHADYEILPGRGDAEQSLRSGLSTSIAGELRPAAEFLLPKRDGLVSRPFESSKTFTLGPDELNAHWIAISDPESGQLLGVFWQGVEKVEVATQRFSTLIELISPPLDQSRGYHFRLGYCFARADIRALQLSYDRFAQLSR